MAGRPQVSVVIPTRDRPEQTRAAVESALAQTLPPHEVIVVDDGSIEAFATDRTGVRVLRHSAPRGAAAARNSGIDAATGNWVAFLDSDDTWRADKLARQFEQFRHAASPEQALCCCNVLVRDSPDDVGKPHNTSPPTGDFSEWILVGGNTPQTSGLMLSTQAARRIRFDEALPRHQDWDFFLRAAAAGLEISYVHEPLVVYDGSRRSDRISHGLAPADTLAWIDGSEGGRLVSRRARHEILCRRVVVGLSDRPLSAVAAVVRAILRGRLRPWPTLRWGMRALTRGP